MTQGRQMGKQTTAATQQRSKTIESSRRQGQQRQGIRCCCNRLKNLGETTPFLHRCSSTQLLDNLFKPVGTDTDAQVPLRKEHIPVPVWDHVKRLIQGLENLGKRIVAGPSAQTAPERRT